MTDIHRSSHRETHPAAGGQGGSQRILLGNGRPVVSGGVTSIEVSLFIVSAARESRLKMPACDLWPGRVDPEDKQNGQADPTRVEEKTRMHIVISFYSRLGCLVRRESFAIREGDLSLAASGEVTPRYFLEVVERDHGRFRGDAICDARAGRLRNGLVCGDACPVQGVLIFRTCEPAASTAVLVLHAASSDPTICSPDGDTT